MINDLLIIFPNPQIMILLVLSLLVVKIIILLIRIKLKLFELAFFATIIDECRFKIGE